MASISREIDHRMMDSQDGLTTGAESLRFIEEPELVATGNDAESMTESSPSPWKGVLRLVHFSGLIVLLAFALNALVGAGLRHIKTSSFGAWNQVMQGRVNADVIVSGSSRATYHYDPRIIESATGRTAFNIGRVGSQTDVQVVVLKAYLEHNRKPDLVIQNLDAFSFVTTREIFDAVEYVPYLNDREIYEPLRRFDPDLAKSRHIPLYGYIVEDMNFTWFQGLKSLVGWSPRENYFLGFNPRSKKWTDEFDNFKRGNPHGASFAIEPAGVEAMEALIRVCKENGIQLVFVYSPEYREMQTLTVNRKEIFAKIQELANRNQVPLWDYSEWRYDDDRRYFYNSQHLNASGAEAFSSDLADRLKNYLVERARQPGAARGTAVVSSATVGQN